MQFDHTRLSVCGQIEHWRQINVIPVRYAVGDWPIRRSATMMTSLLLTSGPLRYEAVLHSCGISPCGGWVPTCESACSW